MSHSYHWEHGECAGRTASLTESYARRWTIQSLGQKNLSFLKACSAWIHTFPNSTLSCTASVERVNNSDSSEETHSVCTRHIQCALHVC